MDWTKYPSFRKKEMACKCCGKAEMDAEFMYLLQCLRSAYAKPLPVTSGYRCPKHNTSVKGGPAHVLGRAADISISGEEAYTLTKLAILHGVTGIGWKQHGGVRFIHLDNLTNKDGVGRPWVWSYP